MLLGWRSKVSFLMIQSDSARLINALKPKVCHHEPGFHSPLEGSLTTKSGFYNVQMASCILTTLFPGIVVDRIPAMPVTVYDQHEHREKDLVDHAPPLSVLAAIHKLLTRKEMWNEPKALEAVRNEAEGMRQMQVWDDNSVQEYDTLLPTARSQGKELNVANLMSICSIKHWETPHKRRYKGRIILRGDDVRNSWGGAAQFRHLYSTPTNLQAVNLALFWGMVWGNVIRVADATRAFLQAELKTPHETWVVLPEELWLKHWSGGFRKPAVQLKKALYGHPQASAFWEQHLRKILIEAMKMTPVDGHPSVYHHSDWQLLVEVYVDDLLCAGPPKFQDLFWDHLRQHVMLDDIEELSQFLGRNHHFNPEYTTCTLDMRVRDYCREAIDMYKDICGPKTVLRQVGTPYVSEGILTTADYEVTGQIATKASSVLMKLLWLCRLARPDLAFAISQLATQVTRWSRNCDKMLFRLVSYLWSTVDLCLTVQIHDPPESCFLNLYADADLGGCAHTSKSTSGLFLVVEGPRGTFMPITWHARRQTHVARSTADAEMNSLSEGLFEELLPAHLLLQRLL